MHTLLNISLSNTFEYCYLALTQLDITPRAKSSYSLISSYYSRLFRFFFQAEDGIRYLTVTGVQTCALPISLFLPVLYRYRRPRRLENNRCCSASRPLPKFHQTADKSKQKPNSPVWLRLSRSDRKSVV